MTASPITSHQPQGRPPGTQIPKKHNFLGFPQFGFSPARSVAGNKRKILVGYSQGQSLDSPFLWHCTILTHTNPSGSSTPGGNVFARLCIKPRSVLAKDSVISPGSCAWPCQPWRWLSAPVWASSEKWNKPHAQLVLDLLHLPCKTREVHHMGASKVEEEV